ncbi:hypothetical protein Phi4:1_gp186 [Cellulophaga phage phi4:1]|uniref:Uncharacterized protein n=3 Tax=Lightbulbvirus Cba41 TaxID=1918524 RepID=A0A0S2MWU1_9CAUD|nr:hypothetical protein Phi4:1_gp186 [Cellulophaga phage phi4:1]AGO49599.1 hypothetical protein Phi4:1_gp186 [Cellulophaga phage phi4:1]ALO80195.1 hypothetical protein Phi4113_186 [Cellulophaga phage phi4:1_13]ALO80392.1 hypothetical protein Phi4118_186 [Cellulophaga phage phi4:1_18]
MEYKNKTPEEVDYIISKYTPNKQLLIHGVSESAFEIKPISMELSEILKQHLASIEQANKLVETLVSKLGIPEKNFGEHSH